MNKISESIFSGKDGIDTYIIPLALVLWIKKEKWGHNIGVGKIRTRYIVHLDKAIIKLPHYTGKRFMEAWCFYRHEIEGGKKRFKTPKEK